MYIVWSSSMPSVPPAHDSVKAVEIEGEWITLTRKNDNRTHFSMCDRKVFIYADRKQAIADSANNGMQP